MDEIDTRLPAARPSKAAISARRRRIARGQRQEEEARSAVPTVPRGLQGLLAFPLLESLDEAGGKARPRDIYEQLADRLEMPLEARRAARIGANGCAHNVFQQQVRWARQTAKAKGLIVDAGRGLWQLADPAYAKLGRVRRGKVYLAWSTALGMGFWAHAEDVASSIEPGSVQLVFTSPVYPITSGRAYGRMTPAVWLDMMTRLTRMWADLICDDGIIALNVADTHIPGIPAISPYLYRFMLTAIDTIGLYEQPPDFWLNPSKLGNIQWSANQRLCPKAGIEHVKYLSKVPFPKRTIDRILEPRRQPSEKAAQDAKRDKEQRPGGYDIRNTAFYAHEDSLPNNLIVAGGAPGNDAYARRCRAVGLPVHPARFPRALPERVILQTTDEHDIVFDPMAGSGTTAAVAMDLGRRAIVTEPMLAYVQGQAMRFSETPGWTWHLPPACDLRR